MNELELYDIITLEDDLEYTIVDKLEEKNQTYLLLAPVDKEEEPNLEEIKIVKLLQNNNQSIVEELDDEALTQHLAAKFLSSIKNNLEQ